MTEAASDHLARSVYLPTTDISTGAVHLNGWCLKERREHYDYEWNIDSPVDPRFDPGLCMSSPLSSGLDHSASEELEDFELKSSLNAWVTELLG